MNCQVVIVNETENKRVHLFSFEFWEITQIEAKLPVLFDIGFNIWSSMPISYQFRYQDDII